jgi:hypothetical protein
MRLAADRAATGTIEKMHRNWLIRLIFQKVRSTAGK